MKAVLIPCLLGIPASGQNILHYTGTSGFDHGTRDVSLAMFQGIAGEHGFNIVNDNDGSTFNSLTSLQQFDAIVFSNTSGAALLDADQRANFEAYIAAGGSAMGIHAATDTYRHSTANGNNTGAWDFYAELIGASVQEDPNHVDGTPLYDLTHIGAHTSTTTLPDPWSKNEEYYYWEGGYYRDDNVPVLEVEETVGPNGEVNSYDAPRPISWYRELPEGGRVFYTALGHAGSNFTEDALFRQHIEGALTWLIGAGTSIDLLTRTPGATAWPVPSTGYVHISAPDVSPDAAFDLYDDLGRRALRSQLENHRADLSGLPDGNYSMRLTGYNAVVPIRIVK